MKRLRLLLLLAVLLTLYGCGAKDTAPTDAVLGRYPGIQLRQADEQWQAMDEVYTGACYLELAEGGRGVLCLDAESMDVDWTLSGQALTLSSAGQSCEGTLIDGTVQIDFFGTQLQLMFGKLPQELTPEKTQEPADGPEDETITPEAFWSGDWYGWYAIVDTSESLGEWKDSAWDACARIALTGQNGTITVWDTETQAGQSICKTEIRLEDGRTQVGCMTAQSGSFLDCSLDGGWSCDPAESDVSEFPDMICISARAVDPANGDWFRFRLYLRPWGTDWSDVKTGDLSGCWYEDMMPPDYSRWYKPLLKKGVQQMPDSFEAGWALLR